MARVGPGGPAERNLYFNDLAAYDLAVHDGSVEHIVSALMAWLVIVIDVRQAVIPRDVAVIPKFVDQR